MPLEQQLKLIDAEAKAIQWNFDEFWKKCEGKGWFTKLPDMKNYLMWVEHEVSRKTWHIQHATGEIRKNAGISA